MHYVTFGFSDLLCLSVSFLSLDLSLSYSLGVPLSLPLFRSLPLLVPSYLSMLNHFSHSLQTSRLPSYAASGTPSGILSVYAAPRDITL